MSKAIETLMNEHRLIEEVLGSLRTFVVRLSSDPGEARLRVAEYAEFFREFADRTHHGKEEDRLFGAMAQHGFPSNGGPVFVMLKEHEIGRAHVRALAEVGGGSGELSGEELETVKSNAEGFILMLSAHIQKEDRILFPAAERAMPGDVLDSLAGEFEEFDSTVIGDQAQQRLRELAAALIAAFPPNTSAPNA